METEISKTKSDLTVEEINTLLNNETNIKTYRKLQYIKFTKMGFSKN